MINYKYYYYLLNFKRVWHVATHLFWDQRRGEGSIPVFLPLWCGLPHGQEIDFPVSSPVMVVAAITYKTCFYLLLHIFYISIHTAHSLSANNQSTDPCPVRSGNVELFRFPNRNKIRAPVSSAGRLRCTLLRRRSMPLPMKNRWCCRALNTYARRAAAPVTNDGVCVRTVVGRKGNEAILLRDQTKAEDNSMCVCAVENSILHWASLRVQNLFAFFCPAWQQ